MDYEKKRREYACHFGDDDIVIDGIVLNPVHLLPQGQWKINQEIDFYMDDGADIYLLRIINSGENSITLCDDEYNDIRYIIVRRKVEHTTDTLSTIVKLLKEFPYAKKMHEKQRCIMFEMDSEEDESLL